MKKKLLPCHKEECFSSFKKIMIIMKLSFIFLAIGIIQVSANVYSQSLSLNLGKKTASIGEILTTIEKETEYKFLFRNDQVELNNVVAVDFTSQNLGDLLSQVFKNTDINYRLVDNNLVLLSPNINNQEVKITGKVTSTNGEVLIGATVVEKGTTNGVNVNASGEYAIQVSSSKAILIFSFIGYETQEIAVEERSVIDVVLKDDSKFIEEVVITGYQTISKERATGSFDILKADKINKSLAPNIVSRLEGKVAGLQISKNGITIRGRGSILSSNEPLVVVDGFPIEGGFSTVNPDDIENYHILKDAAAASIWGVRAANGVIVITTKKGSKSEQVIDITSQFSMSQKSDLNDYRLVSPSEAVDYELELIEKEYWETRSITSWNSPVNKVGEAYYATLLRNGMDQTYEQVTSDPLFIADIKKLKKANLYNQFKEHLMRNASQQRINASLRGGSDRNQYYVSSSFDFNKSEMVGNKNNEVLLNLKNDYNISKRITLSSGVNIKYNKRDNNGFSIDDVRWQHPFHNILDENGNRIQYYTVDPWEGKRREAMGYLPYTTNLLDVFDQNNSTSESFSARVQQVLSFKIIDGLSVETRFQYEKGFGKNESIKKASHPDMRQLINDYTLVNADGSLNRQFPLGSGYFLGKNEFEAWTWRNQLSFNKDFSGGKHQLSSIFGQEMRLYRNSSNSNSQYAFDNETLKYMPLNESMWYTGEYNGWSPLGGPSFSLFNGYNEDDNRDISLYTNGSYTLNKKYTFSASGRIDQSNIYGNDSKYKYNVIWSSGLSWKISEENFAKFDWLDMLLLRVTYGIGGNVNKQFYPVLMGASEINYTSGVKYTYLTNPANNKLKWETAKTLNLGIDGTFLSNRLNVKIDLYNKRSNDLLGRVALDPTNGFSSAQINFASLYNRGLEFTINSTPLIINDFKWDLGFNITYNKNEVTKVESEGSSASSYINGVPGLGVAFIGKSLSRLYAYPFAGLNDKGEPTFWENGQKVPYQDYSRDPKTLVYLGQTDAPWFGGVSTTLSYKGFSLYGNAIFKFGHKFLMPTGSMTSSMALSKTFANRWKKPGDELTTNVPALTSGTSNNQYTIDELYQVSDIHVRDAAFVRFNELALSYTFDKQMLKKMPIKALDIFFQVRNVGLWTANDEKVDPETVATHGRYGSTSLTLPDTKSYIVGFKVNF